MASTMPVQLVTSTFLSTAAPVGHMAVLAQWQVVCEWFWFCLFLNISPLQLNGRLTVLFMTVHK